MTRSVPPPDVLEVFGLVDPPQRTHSSDVWRVGAGIVKRVRHHREAEWMSELVSESVLPASFRLARPIRARDGRWVVDGWTASEWLEGEANGSAWAEIMAAGTDFHRWLAHLDRPAWLEDMDNPWRQADRIAWGEEAEDLEPAFMPLIEELEGMRRPLDQREQLVHGDLCGNVLFAQGLPPAVIDLTLYWRPVGYADAVVAVDAYEWRGAGPECLQAVARRPDGVQLLIRGALFRITRSAMDPWSNPSQRVDIHRRTVEKIRDLSAAS